MIDEYTFVDFDAEFNPVFLSMIPENRNDARNKHIIQGGDYNDFG